MCSFLAVLGLHCWAGFFSGWREWGLVVVLGFLTAASHVVEHRPWSARALEVAPRGLSSCNFRAPEHRLIDCGKRAQLFHGMWDLPRPGFEPVSPALGGGLFTTVLSGKPG